MDYQVTTAPMHEPVSIEQAKRHLRITESDSDNDVAALLSSATRWCELYANSAFLWQSITARMDNLSDDSIRMPCSPLISVTSIKYKDVAGSEQTVDTGVYEVDTSSEPGKIILAYNQTWPSVRGHHHDVTIEFICGHAKTFSRSSNQLTVAGHLFRMNDFVQVYNIGGGLPTDLSAGTNYYVRAVSGHNIELALTEGGPVVAMSEDGTGTHYIDAMPRYFINAILLVLTDLWSHRGDDPDGKGGPSRAVRELLSMGRMIVI